MLGAMSRVSQARARENRQRVVEVAARLFRERGVAQVSVADVMAEAGLTHGGFYKQFTSKDALAVEALAQGLAEIDHRLATIGEPGDEGGWASFLDFYLSSYHRDSPGDGCPSPASRATCPAPTPTWPQPTLQEPRLSRTSWAAPLALSTAVGALILARATAGTELSDRILTDALASLEDSH